MNYYKVSFNNLNESHSPEMVMAFIADMEFESFEENENQLIAYIKEDNFKLADLQSIGFLKSLFENDCIKYELVKQQNWNAVWESNYPPVKIGSCFIRAPFHEENKDAEYNILLNPKMAFGTAHHETTAMMIEYLLENDFANQQILDMGSGTAVLAILASMKNADSIVAIDNDNWAWENAIENAGLNNIENIEAVLGDAETLVNYDEFDTIFANINKNILLNDIKRYKQVLKKGGNIYFSGFYLNDLEDIKQECNKYSLEFVSNKLKNNWVAAEFVKN